MEPHNKKGLIWIVAFFLILNGGLALFAFMCTPTRSQQCCWLPGMSLAAILKPALIWCGTG